MLEVAGNEVAAEGMGFGVPIARYADGWVYARTAPRTYARRRVRLDYQVGELAVLLDGPEPGAEVLTAGVAELFGTEFGAGN